MTIVIRSANGNKNFYFNLTGLVFPFVFGNLFCKPASTKNCLSKLNIIYVHNVFSYLPAFFAEDSFASVFRHKEIFHI